MTLEEAIKRCKEQANLLEESAAGCDMTDKVEKEIACRSGKCAAEYRQLAEWLKELKAVQDIIKQHDRDSMPEDYWYIDKIRTVVLE